MKNEQKTTIEVIFLSDFMEFIDEVIAEANKAELQDRKTGHKEDSIRWEGVSIFFKSLKTKMKTVEKNPLVTELVVEKE